MDIKDSKSRPVSYADKFRQKPGLAPTQRRPRGPADQQDFQKEYANSRVADAFGSSYEDYNQPLGDYLMGLEKKAGQAINDFGNTPVSGADVWDLFKSVPSAGTRVATNALGGPQDTSDMIWALAHAINQGQRRYTGYDAAAPIMRAQKLDQDLGSYLPKLQNSEQLQESAKQNLWSPLTYEPKGPLGGALHTAADFVNPEDVGGFLGARKLMRRF